MAEAPGLYEAVSDQFTEFMQLGEAATDADIARMAASAASLRFEISSDYQQDKAIPAWNLSPQPGPTYFMSSITHYVHIICMDSCGKAFGSSTHSRNVVYARSEETAGHKTCDDTLSTVADALLGSCAPNFPQPRLFRSGYDADGIVD